MNRIQTLKQYREIMRSWGPPYHSGPGSQMGTDEWLLQNIFKGFEEGYFVEVGCYNGIDCSNTIILEKFFHWTGLNIEAGKINFDKLKVNRPNIITIHSAVSSEIKDIVFVEKGGQGKIINKIDDIHNDQKIENIIYLKTNTLQNILNEQKAPKTIHYLSIDVEGCELDVLKGIDFSEYKFLVMQVERNGQETAMIDFLKNKKYNFIQYISGDALFLHYDAYDFFKIPTNEQFPKWTNII